MNKLFIAILLLTMMSCKRESAHILPQDKMTKVMWEMVQADEWVTGYVSRDSTRNQKLERMKLYQQIFTLNKVAEEDYYTSFKFYAAKPGMFKRLLDSLSERGVREQRAFNLPGKPMSK